VWSRWQRLRAEQPGPQTNGNTNMATRKTNATAKKTTTETNAKKAIIHFC